MTNKIITAGIVGVRPHHPHLLDIFTLLPFGNGEIFPLLIDCRRVETLFNLLAEAVCKAEDVDPAVACLHGNSQRSYGIPDGHRFDRNFRDKTTFGKRLSRDASGSVDQAIWPSW
jgi:hypothetical protein